MVLSTQLAAGEARMPLKETVLSPWLAPNLLPLITTTPRAPIYAGVTLDMFGWLRTTKFTPLLAAPPTVTPTFPVVAPAGTVTPMLLALQLATAAGSPLNVTSLEPWLPPKFEPLIVTAAPIAPDRGDKPEITGDGPTVKAPPLHEPPPAAVTTTFPVVAPAGTVAATLLLIHNVTLAAVPLKVTLPLP